MVFSDSLVAPNSLLFYEALIPRKRLTPKETQLYEQLRKGFIGEQKIERMIKTNNFKNILPLYDSLFEIRGTEFQVDCILLTARTIYLLEIKNYTGDYYIENEKIFNLRTKAEIYNPISQLQRTEFLFKRFLNDRQIKMEVRSYVIFVNNRFMLYDVPTSLPMIFPSQIKLFMQKINANTAPLTENNAQLAKMLVEGRKGKSVYERIPEYDLSQLKRGVFCKNCLAELERSGRHHFRCSRCGQDFHMNEVVLFSAAQYYLLFPDEKITTQTITEWCGEIISIKTIRKILAKNLEKVPKGKHTHYNFKKKADHLTILQRKLD